MIDAVMNHVEKERLFTKEYSRLFDRLYRHVRARVHSLHDAEDIVSDVILDGFRTLANYDAAKGNLEQWLMGVARYKLIAYWKKSLPTLDVDALDNLVGDSGDMSALDGALAWVKIMERVPADYHPLFTMRFSLDMSYDEMAEVTGKSPEALRQMFSRLLRKLRVELTETTIV